MSYREEEERRRRRGGAEEEEERSVRKGYMRWWRWLLRARCLVACLLVWYLYDASEELRIACGVPAYP